MFVKAKIMYTSRYTLSMVKASPKWNDFCDHTRASEISGIVRGTSGAYVADYRGLAPEVNLGVCP